MSELKDLAALLSQFATKLSAFQLASPEFAQAAVGLAGWTDSYRLSLDEIALIIKNSVSPSSTKMVSLVGQIMTSSYEVFQRIERLLPNTQKDQRNARLVEEWTLRNEEAEYLMRDTEFLTSTALDLESLLTWGKRFVNHGMARPLSKAQEERCDQLTQRLLKRRWETSLETAEQVGDDIDVDNKDDDPTNDTSRKGDEPSSDSMFIHYTISEDRTGNDHSIISARLAALGQRTLPTPSPTRIDIKPKDIRSSKPGVPETGMAHNHRTTIKERMGMSESVVSARLSALGARSERRL